jgi:hypothetical protein
VPDRCIIENICCSCFYKTKKIQNFESKTYYKKITVFSVGATIALRMARKLNLLYRFVRFFIFLTSRLKIALPSLNLKKKVEICIVSDESKLFYYYPIVPNLVNRWHLPKCQSRLVELTNL